MQPFKKHPASESGRNEAERQKQSIIKGQILNKIQTGTKANKKINK